jgi:hypothetical protein
MHFSRRRALRLAMMGAAFPLARPFSSRASASPQRQDAQRYPRPKTALTLLPKSHAEFVRVVDGKFILHGRETFLKGTNYFGSWRRRSTIPRGEGIEDFTVWSFYDDWDAHEIGLDLQFIRAQLNATCIRIGTPARTDFDNLVRYHGYQPWYSEDGAITDVYKSRLLELSDAAYQNDLRLQICLAWNIKNEIADDPEAFAPGGKKDLFYEQQILSIASALKHHPGVIGYSVGNEVLIRWELNGQNPSWFEPRAASFMLRHIRNLRKVAPSQLVTTDEIAAPSDDHWFSPGMHFKTMPDLYRSNGGSPFRLVDEVDYIGSHFYPATFRKGDSADRMRAELDDCAAKLKEYLDAAASLNKPVVLNEFGLKLKPWTLTAADYRDFRDMLFERILDTGQRIGLKGFLAWLALPQVVLRPGDYKIVQSTVNRFFPVELDVKTAGRVSTRTLGLEPSFSLFDWDAAGDTPKPTRAAKALAGAWQPLK